MFTPRKVALLSFMVLAMAVGLALELPIDQAEADRTCPPGEEQHVMCLLQQVYGRVALIVAGWCYGAAAIGALALYWIPRWLDKRRAASRRDRGDMMLPPSMRR